MTTRVAFQGVAGAYSEEAIRQYFGPEVETVPCRALDDLFPVVEGGDADYGMMPVENAVAGSVPRSYELLMEHDLRVWAEVMSGSSGTPGPAGVSLARPKSRIFR